MAYKNIAIWILFCLLANCSGDSPPVTVSSYPSKAPSLENNETVLPGNTPTRGIPITLASTPSPQPSPTISSTPTIPTTLPTQTQPPLISMVFTGQIVPGRCVQAGVDKYGNADYIYASVAEYLSNADLTIGTLNASLTDFPPTTGCIETFILVGRPENADAMARAGFDVMSVATNHIKNCSLSTCGDKAFLDTLYHLNRVGITPVGAGENLSEAIKPVLVTIKGVSFGILSLGQIEQNAFAGEDSPGIAILNPQNLQESILHVRDLVDVVIVIPHWGPEYSIMPNPSQQKLAQIAVEAGADLVVGNHTHVIQAYTEIDNVPVFFGLGNFVFDQTWDRENQQSLILKIYFEGKKYNGFEILTVWADMEGRVSIANPDEAQQILSRVEKANQKLP